MSTNQKPQKGLSDSQLASKYESGKINFSKVLNQAINKTTVKASAKGK